MGARRVLLDARAPLRQGPCRCHTTVNAEEVGKFSAYGSSWWARDGRGADPLHTLNPVRVRYIRTRAASGRGLKGLRVLDAGCGGGLLSEALARCGARVTGVDPSKESIEVARAHARIDPLTRSIQYEHTTVEELEGATYWSNSHAGVDKSSFSGSAKRRSALNVAVCWQRLAGAMTWCAPPKSSSTWRIMSGS
jgi:SAM-dependent methyltransferase